MARLSPLMHLGSILVACLIVFGIQPQNRIDLKPWISARLQSYLIDYTPYYPGQKELYRHEIFSPRYTHSKKIVILGASVAESIGCDSSWSKIDPERGPLRNVHYSCSIAGHMNDLLKNKGLNDWRVFDLGREGGRLTSMLYTYSRIAELKPEIVIFADAAYLDQGLYAQTENAGAAFLDGELYAYMDRFYGSDSASRGLWRSYRDHLIQGGRSKGWVWPEHDQNADFSDLYDTRTQITLNDLLMHLLGGIHDIAWLNAPPWPVKYSPNYRVWPTLEDSPYVDPDKDFGYFQGYELLQLAQAKNNGKFLYYFSPLLERRNSRAYHDIITSGAYGQYFRRNQIAYADLTNLPLQPVYETYDGTHQTTFGNERIAAALFDELEQRHFIP